MHKNIINPQFDAKFAIARKDVKVNGTMSGFDVACARFVGSLRRLVSMLRLQAWHHQTTSRLFGGSALRSDSFEQGYLCGSERQDVGQRYSGEPDTGKCQTQAQIGLKPALTPVPSLVTI